MKKIAAVVLAAVLACFSLCMVAGCSGSTDYTAQYSGTWICAAVDDGNGTVVNISDYASMGITGDQFMTMDLNKDGTCTITAFGEDLMGDTTTTLTWTGDAKGVSIEANGQTLDLPYDSSAKQLTLTYDGQSVMFEKKA